jgi:hypothetical protein
MYEYRYFIWHGETFARIVRLSLDGTKCYRDSDDPETRGTNEDPRDPDNGFTEIEWEAANDLCREWQAKSNLHYTAAPEDLP